MHEQRKHPSRRDYLNDFHPTADGNFVYSGSHLTWSSTGLSRRRALIGFWFLALIQAIGVIVCGSIPAPGMLNCAWVILPYAAAAASAFLLILALIRLTFGGDPLREYIHRKTVRRFPIFTGACIGFCVLSILTEMLYRMLYGWEDHKAYAAVYLVGQVLQVLCALLWRKLNGRVRWQTV